MSSRTGFAVSLAAALAVTMAHADARAQGDPQPMPAPQPMQAVPPGGYYAPAPGAYPYPYPYPPGRMVVAPQPPRVIDLEEGQSPPAGYHKTTKPRLGLVIGGAVLFGLTWLTSAAGGAIAQDAGVHNGALLAIPVAGPFALMPSGSATGNFFLVLDGLSQAGGLAMLIAGLAAPKTVAERDLAGLRIMPTPMTFGANSAGLGFVGKF